MPMSVGAGGVWKNVVSMWVGAGGVWKLVQQLSVGAAGAWKLGFAALTVSASNVSRSITNFAACATVTTVATPGTAVSGGSGSYTYLWECTDQGGYGSNFTCSNTAAASPTWSASVCGVTYIQTWRVTVTDTVTGATAQRSITVQLQHISNA